MAINFAQILRDLLDAFRPKKPPVEPPPPVEPAISPLVYGRLTIWGPTSAVPDATGVLTADDGSPPINSFSNDAGRLTFIIDTKKTTFGFGATLTISAPGYAPGTARVVLGNPDNPRQANVDWPDVQLRQVSILQPLRIRGEFFEQINGARITLKQCSEFALFARYMNGENIVPVIDERVAMGFTLFRVWLLNTSVFRVVPSDYPDFYDRIPDFLLLCGQHGAFVEFTVFTQAPSLMPNRDDQIAHWSRVVNACRMFNNKAPQGSLVLISRVNEADHRGADGALDNDSFPMPRPSGVIASNGSNGAGNETPPEPIWDYTEYHTNDTSEWWRKTGHNAMEISERVKAPCLAGENTRPDKDGNANHHHDAALGAALLCAGACFHSESGKNSRLFNTPHPDKPNELWMPNDRACAEAWIAGANAVPLEFQDGSYTRQGNDPGILRTYTSTLSDGRNFQIKIRD